MWYLVMPLTGYEGTLPPELPVVDCVWRRGPGFDGDLDLSF